MHRKRGWVACDTTFENAFFEFFQRRLSTHPTPGAPPIPLRWRPQPPAHPDGLHTTGSSAGRARCKADHTRPDAGHAAPVCTRYQTGRTGYIRTAAGLDCLRGVSGKVYNFGRLFLSIFIWIYFVESIDNPHIYGYNIISPDKYGLQPH